MSIGKQWSGSSTLLFRKYTFSCGKMSTFVKPTRTQEKNTSKTHEKTWKNDEKTWQNEKSHVNFLGALLKQKHLFYWWNFTPTWTRALKTTPKNTPKYIKKHEKMMNTNEHTRECSFSDNTRFQGKNSIFVKTNMKNQRKHKRKRSKNKADFRWHFSTRDYWKRTGLEKIVA